MAVISPSKTPSKTKPSAPQSEREWTSRPVLATLVRTFLRLAPALTAISASLTIVWLAGPQPTRMRAFGVSLISAAVGFLIGIVVGRITFRILPLATLLRLSYIFPDEAPSRFRVALRSSSTRQLARLTDEARENGDDEPVSGGQEQILELLSTIGTHDRRTRGHSERVRIYARLIGEELGYHGAELDKLQWGALLHDIGKLAVPPEILNKPGKPTEEEWITLRRHPEAGDTMMAPLRDYLGHWADSAGYHHEKWDGSGYPNGLAGRDIPVAGRIVAVADAYEVMTSVRSYKQPMSVKDARANLTADAGTHFDPAVVRALVGISVGKMRIAMGPLWFVLGVPFLSPLAPVLSRLGLTKTQVVGPALAGVAAVGSVAGGFGAGRMPAQLAFVDAPEAARYELVEDSSELDAGGPITLGSLSPTTSEAPPDRPTLPTTVPSPLSDATDTSVSVTTNGSSGPTTSTSSTSTTTPTTTESAPTTLAPTTVPPTTQPTIPTTESPATTPASPAPLVTITGGPGTYEGQLLIGSDLTAAGLATAADVLHVWLESEQTLTSDLVVGGRTVPAGTRIRSFYFSFSSDRTIVADARFTGDVLAIATTGADLAATDAFAPSGVSYDPERTMEANDLATPSSTAVTVKLVSQTGGLDQLRVIVAA